MNETRTYRRLASRRRHASRSVAVSIALTGVAIVAAYAGIELALAALGFTPLLLAPETVIDGLAAASWWVLPASIGAVIVGVVLVILAVSPGRRARRELADDRMSVIIDDSALAAALATTASTAVAVRRTRVSASVSARRASVVVAPTSGIAVDRTALEREASALIERLAPKPSLRVLTRVRVDGVVGS